MPKPDLPTSSRVPAGLAFGLCLALLLASPGLRAEQVASREASVLDLFPASGLPSAAGEVSCTFDYVPSGSKWHPKVDERAVFFASMKGEGWQLGVGKGGHIYSLRGPYGESVPPQRVSSPWNDEVWQAVATNEGIVTPIHEYQAENRDQYAVTEPLMYFIHQAGIYTPGAAEGDASKPAAFYSPCLGRQWDPRTRTLRMVNWMQQAHTPCVWKSGVLIYTAFRDVGGGAIEVNQVLHQFAGESLSYFSLPWGGVRKSSLPHTVMSKADGSWAEESGMWNWDGVPNSKVDKTGGWEAWVRNIRNDASPALAFVFGRGQGKESPGRREYGGRHLILWGSAGRDDVRDYQVTEVSGQFGLGRQGSLSIRWYLVSGSFAQVRQRAAELAPYAHVQRKWYGTDAVQPLFTVNGEVTLENTRSEGHRWGSLLSFPVEGASPVFLLVDRRTGQQVVTADLYALAESDPYPNPLPADHPEYHRYQNRVIYKQYSPHIGYRNLLGYAFENKPGDRSARPVSAPEGVRLHASVERLWMMD
jgi:hypothetical protein